MIRIAGAGGGKYGSSCYTATLCSSYFAHIFGGGYAAGYYAYCGRKCWPMMVTSGLLSRADYA